jgi:hypothetical protein
MKERPILFSGQMIRAILSGQKTQTRRVVKPQPTHFLGANPEKGYTGLPYVVTPKKPHHNGMVWEEEDGTRYEAIRCPYDADYLWVRETWGQRGAWLYYKADHSEETDIKWKPSIHMPRCHSRILLEVGFFTTQRLCNISEEDARAEGVESVAQFFELWDTINPGIPVASNPVVWVVNSKMVKREI